MLLLSHLYFLSWFEKPQQLDFKEGELAKTVIDSRPNDSLIESGLAGFF